MTVDNRPGNQSIKQFNVSLSDIERVAQKSSAGASRGIEGIERSAIRASASVKQSFSGLSGAIASVGLGALARDAFKVASGFEASRIGIKALLGDTERAASLFKEIQAFALESPFQFADLLEGTQRLIAFKFEADSLIPTLEAVSAAVGALGGDRGKLADLITALGQIRTATKLQGEELRQLRNLGLERSALEGLAEAYGKTVAEIQAMQEKGLIPGLEAADIIIRRLTKDFGEFNKEVALTTKTAFSNVLDALGKFSDDVLRDHMPAIREGLNGIRAGLEDLSKWIRENPDIVVNLAKGIGILAATIVSSKIINLVAGLGGAFSSLVTAASGHPIVAAAAVTLGVMGYEAWRTSQRMDALNESLQDSPLSKSGQIRSQVSAGATIRDLEKLGFTATEIKLAFEGTRKAIDGLDTSGLPKIKLLTGGAEKPKPPPGLDEEFIKRRASAEKAAAEILDRARKGELDGMDKLIEEFRQYREELGLSAKAVADLSQAELLRAKALLGKEFADAEKELRKVREDSAKDEIERANDIARLRAEAFIASQEQVSENRRQAIEQEDIALQAARDRRIREAESFEALDIQSKIALEAKKAEIEIQYIGESNAVKLRSLDVEQQIEIAKAGDNAALKLAIDQKYVLARQALEQSAQAAIDAQRENAVNEQGRLIIDHNREAFESVKRSASSLLDQLLSRTRSWGDAFKAILRAAILTPLKEFGANLIATLVTGQSAIGSRPGRGGGGIFPGLFGIFGGGGVGGFGIGSPGAPGGTGGFAGPVTGLGGLGGRAGGFAGLAGAGGILSRIGNIGHGPIGGDFGGEVAGSFRGIGGNLGGGLLLGGAALAGFGLQRGGLSGLAMTAAGGSLIGAKFGGPLGAAIGGGIGAVAGLIRMFVKSSAEKVQSKVRQIYGVDIDRKFAQDPLVGIIKQSFGGNIEVGLRSPQVRDLIQLYAMSRGQALGGALAPVGVPSSFGFRGQQLITQPTYYNGQPIQQGFPAATPAASIVVNLNPEETRSFWETQTLEVMGNNPAAVQSANIAAANRNISRRQLTAAMLAPGVVTAG